MTNLSASYYDGQTSQRRAVKVKLTMPGYLVLQELGRLSRYRLEDVDISEQLGSQPARVGLPDGARLEIADSQAFYAALAHSSGRSQWLHAFESRWSMVVAALATMLLALGAAYLWGIPWLAKQLAYSVSREAEAVLGEEGLAMLDARVLTPSELDYQRQLQLTAEFMDVVSVVGGGDSIRYELVFRKGGELGANALALPSGIIVLTDELVALAEHDEELAAVLAHEAGHIRNRHSLRALLQNSAVAGLIVVLTGDASSATSIAAGIPTLLAERGYSREFEYEADEVAREYLLVRDIPLQRYADILLRIDSRSAVGPAPLSLLATHPRARERAQAFQ